MQLLLLCLKHEKPTPQGRAGSQREAPPEGSRKSRRESATEDNFGIPVDALDGPNARRQGEALRRAALRWNGERETLRLTLGESLFPEKLPPINA